MNKNIRRRIRVNWNGCLNITYVKQEYLEGFGWRYIASKNFRFFEKGKNKK